MNRVWIMMIASLLLLVGPAWMSVAQDATSNESEGSEPAEAETTAEGDADDANTPAPDAEGDAEDAPPADAEAEGGDEPGDIRFQFDGVPYEVVVERFAQMAEKPLVTETDVEGTLTFSDPDPYDYEEAFDAINIMLATKQAALVESGRFLKLVSLDNIERTNTDIFRGLDDTGDARPGEIVTVVLELEHLAAADILEAAQGMLSPAGSIAPMTRESGIIITDRLSSIRRIQRLITEVDTESAVQRQMKTYNLVSAPGAVLANLINQTFGEATAPRRLQYNRRAEQYQELSPNPEDYVTAIWDDPSRNLILFGPRDRIELAEELIDQFEDEAAGQAGEVKIFYPSTQSADDLAEIIREAIPGVASPGRGRRGDDDSSTMARVIVDGASERLIVTAPAASQLNEIEQLIRQVDDGVEIKGEESPDRVEPDRLTVTRVFELEDIEPDTAQEAVTQATTTVGPGSRREERLQITVDRQRGNLIVTGAPGDVQTAEEIVGQLRNEEPVFPRRTQLISVANDEEAQRLLPLVRDLYEEQRGERSRDGATASIMIDPGNGRLIVSGGEEDVTQIEEIVDTLRSADPPQTRTVEVISFEATRIAEVMDDVRSLVEEAMDSPDFRDSPAPYLLPDETNNRLIATATESQLERIQQIVATIDVQPDRVEREIFVVELEHKSADEIIPTVTDLLDEVGEDRGDRPAPRLMPHARDGRLIVLATEQDYEQIAELIEQFDEDEPSVPRQTRTVDLADEDAQEIADLVRELYEEQRRGEDDPPGGTASISTGRDNRRLIITGPEDELGRVEQLVSQITETDEEPTREETRVFRLRNAQAEQIEGLLDKSINGDGSRPVVRILLDEPSNSLIVSGTPENLDAAGELIDELDQQPESQPRRLRLFDLSEGNAAQLEPLISNLFEQMMREQHGRNYDPETRIFSDAGSNRIVALGPENEVEHIADLVEELDRGDPRAAEPGEVFELEHADAENVAEIITEALTRQERGRPVTTASVTADVDTNSVVVGGTEDDVRAARNIVERLDSPSERSSRQMEFVEVEQDNADQLATLASDLWQDQTEGDRDADRVSIRSDNDNDRLIVIAPESQLEPVRQLIESLDRREGEEPEQRQLHRLALDQGTHQQWLDTIEDLYREQAEDDDRPARLMAGPTSGHILVVGSEGQAEQVRQIIATLQEDVPGTDRETRYFAFNSARQLNRILPLARDLYEEEFGDNPGEADANFLADTEGARLIVTGRPDHLERIATLLDDLGDDAPDPDSARQTRIFNVGNAGDVDRLEPLVRDLYEEQFRDTGADGPADAQILADEEAGRLIVTARPAHLEKIEQIIEQLEEDGPEPQPRETRVYDLDATDADDVSDTLRQLYEEHAADRRAAPVDRVLILPDEATNRLVVTAPPSELEHIESLLDDLDRVTEQSGDTRVVELNHAEAPEVAELISSALVDIVRGRNRPRVSVGAHEGTNTLIISGDAEDLRAAELIVQRLDGDDEEQTQRVMQTFNVRAGDTDDLADQVERLFREQSRGGEGKADALIMPDEASDRLIVTATEAQMETIEQIVQMLGPAEPDEPRETRMIDIGSAEQVERLTPMVEDLYESELEGDRDAGPADARIMPDPEAGRILVTARPAHADRVEAIIDRLIERDDDPAERETRVYELTASQADDLADTVTRLFEEKAEGRDDVSPDDLLVLPDPATNRLIVTGVEAQLDEVESIIDQIDQVSTQTADTRLFKLETSEAEQVASLLSQAMLRPDPRGRGRMEARVAVGADERSNTVIVSGDREDLQAAAMIIEQLDGVVEQRDRDLRIFELQSEGKAEELAEHARELYLDQLKSNAGRGSADAQFIPDSDTNRLIVTADVDHMETIDEIVETLDASGEQAGRQMRVLAVDTSAGALVGVVNQMLVEQVEASTPAERLIVSAAPDDRSIVVNAPRRTIERVEELVESLDDPERPNQLEIRSYHVPEGDVTELAPTLARLFAEEGDADGAAEPRFEAAGQNIMVAATAEQFERIETLIDDLQTPAEITSRVETFTLEHADPAEVEQVLQQMLGPDTGAPGMPSWMQRRLMYQQQDEQQTPVRITAAPSVSAVLVQGSPSNLSLAEELVSNLDVPPGEDRHSVEIRSYTVAEGDVTQLAPTLANLFAEQEPDSASPQPRFEPDASGDRIMVAATEAQFERIDVLMEDFETPPEADSRIETFKLEHAEPSEIQQILQEMLSDGSEDDDVSPWMRRRFGQDDDSDDTEARVTAARAIRSVIVQGTPQQLSLAEHLIENLDVPAEEHERMEIRAYRVPEGDVSELAPTLARLFAEDDADAAGPQPRFEADPASGNIMVAATEDQFPRIEKLVEELQTPAEISAQLQTFTLEHADADQAADVLEQMLTDEAELSGLSGWMRARAMEDREDSDETPIRITAVRNINAVMVQAGPAQLTLAEQLIENIDVPEGDADSTLRTVRLDKAEAESLAVAVNDAIAARDEQFEGESVSVTPEPNSNSLLINGPDRAVEGVLELIRELDEQGDHQGIDVRIFRIENGEAQEISAMLEDMLEGVFGRQGGTDDLTISVDERTNSLMVAARPAQFALVEQLLAAVDDAPETMDREIRYVRVENADPFDVASRLRQLFEDRDTDERPVIEADLLTDSITIIAPPDDLGQIEDMVAELDEVSRDETIQVRVLSLAQVPAEEMAEMLRDVHGQMSSTRVEIVDRLPQNLRPEAPGEPLDPDAVIDEFDLPDGHDVAAEPVVAIAAEENSNTLLLSGPGYELDAIETLVNDLSFSYVSSESDFRRFDLEHADPEAVAETLTELFREEPVEVVMREGEGEEGGGERRQRQQQPQITVVPESRTRSVIVRAEPSHFDVIETLIEQLDADGVPPQTELRFFALDHAAPDRLLPVVEDMIEHLQETRPGDTVSVHIDEASRSLVVIGPEAVFEQVGAVVEQFDTDATLTEADVRLVPLTETEATTMADVLNEMLAPASEGQTTAEAQALQEQIRRLNIRNDNDEAVTLNLAEPIKVTASEASNFLILTSTPENLPALAAVAEMMDTVPLIDGVDVRLITLENADADAVQETLDDIFTQGQELGEGPAGDALPDGESGEALTAPLNIAVDERTNTLILSGHPAALELAENLTADLDQDVDRFVTEVELFQLSHASAENVAPLLQSVFAEDGSDPGAEGLATQVTRLRRVLEDGEEVTTEQPKTRAALTVQAEELTNTLVVAARSDMMPLISDVIETMDIPAATGVDNIRITPLEHADAETVESVINDLYDGPLASQMPPGDRPHITTDPRTNALIIAGNEKTWGIINGLIQQLDRDLPVDLRDVRMILVENGDAQALASMIQQLLDARVEQREGLTETETDALRAEIIADPRTNALLVAGSREAFETVESLATQLDEAGPALAGQIDLVALEHANAGTLATTLSNLFTQRYAAAQTADVSRREPIILPDLRTNSLMIVATGDDRRAIEDLLDQLDRQPESPAVQIELVTLRNNQATEVSQMLSQVFAARMQAATAPDQQPEPSQAVDVQPELLTNSVVITASEENIEVARDLIEQIDVEPVIQDGAIRTFAFEHAEAHRAAATLESLVSQGVYRPGAEQADPQQQTREQVAIEVNPSANAIIVSASSENMAVIEQVVERIDTEGHTADATMRIYTLEHASAARLVTTLTDFFDAREATQQQAAEPALPVTVVADDRTNALLITGGPESFATVDRLIERLDVEDSLERDNYRVFSLEHATAAKVEQTLDQLFENRPSAPNTSAPQPINVIADPWTNTVIVSAAAEDMAMVASLVDRLDVAPEHDDDNVEIIRLAKADATEVAQTIEELYNQSDDTGDISINVDERINALVVSAGHSDTRRISDLAERLDTEDLARVAEIRVFQLEHANADDLTELLTELLTTTPDNPDAPATEGQRLLQFVARTADNDQEQIASALQEGVLITPDARTNSLVISAPVEAMPMLEHIISRLDASSPQIARIRVFSLDNADANQMAEVLQDLFRLQQTAAENERSIRYTLVRSDEEEVPEGDLLDAPATLGTAEQNALTVTVDVRTNSLLVGGTQHYVSLASELIEELDSSPAQERISRVYRLRNAQATDIEPAVRDFLDQERERVTQILGEEGIGTVDRLLDREVAIVAEETSNTLLLSASPRYFDDIATLIDELDQPQSQVLIQVMLAEVTLDDTLDLGMEWRYTPIVDGTPVEAGTDFGVADDVSNFGGFSAMITGGDFEFLLRALQEEGRLEVLSRPQILAADNMEADIEVGSRVPLVTDSRVTERGDTITSFDYEQVGVALNVTPRIGADGFVNLTVAPTISAVSQQTVQVSPGLDVPIIDERRALTQVSVQDGNTIILGGLISTRDDRTEDKVPFFGDLPLIGAAFRSTQTSRERTELLIILTPHVIQDIADANEITREHLGESSVHEMPEDDPLRQRLMREIKEDGVYKVDPEPTEREDDFSPIRHDLYEDNEDQGFETIEPRDRDSENADDDAPQQESSDE